MPDYKLSVYTHTPGNSIHCKSVEYAELLNVAWTTGYRYRK